MTWINIIIYFFVLFNCNNEDFSNEYAFSESATGWCVIINGCKNGGNFIDGNKRRFIFPDNGILLANMEGFKITPNDIFLMDGNVFNPNSEDSNSHKLCYFNASLNSGYNAKYLAKEQGLPLLEENIDPMQNFDFYFFRVNKNCDSKVESTSELFDSLYLYLLKNNVYSIR